MMLSSSPQVAPRLAPSRPAEREGRSAGDGHLLERDGARARVDEADPLPIGREERGTRRAQTRERRRFELIQCAHEELRAGGSRPFVDDARAVRRDREVDTLVVHGQRRRTR